MKLHRLHVEITVTAILLLLTALYILRVPVQYSEYCSIDLILYVVCFGAVTVICLSLSSLYFWILIQGVSPHQSFFTFHAFIFLRILGRILGIIWMRRLRASWKNPRHHQERLLLEMIKENGDTEYGRQYGLKDVANLEEFCKHHPLTQYEHYRPYVDRMVAGEENVMLSKPVVCYCRTSGTTGKQKMIPYNSGKDDLIVKIMCLLDENIRAEYPSLGLFQKRMALYVHPRVTQTPTGVNIQTIGTRDLDNPALMSFYPTPATAFSINTGYEANYVHFLFGLLDPGVGSIHLLFLSQLHHALVQLEQVWKDIVNDIETGSLNEQLQLPDDIRRDITRDIRGGDPQRASDLRREFEKGMDGIMKRVWPRFALIIAPDNTGIWPSLQRTYAKGISLIPDLVGCTEGFLAPYIGAKYGAKPAYHFLPDGSVVEFIKVEDVYLDQPKTYFIDELEIDQCYELVISQSSSGLYRYRYGDIIKITGFTDNCPIFEFMYRLGQILNLYWEKIDQKVAEDAVRAAAGRWTEEQLLDFSFAESTLLPKEAQDRDQRRTTPHYLVFLEFGPKDSHGEPLPDLAATMLDQELRNRNVDFHRLREEGAIAIPRLHALRPGAFHALRDHLLATTGATADQYKPPRKLRTLRELQFLQSWTL